MSSPVPLPLILLPPLAAFALFIFWNRPTSGHRPAAPPVPRVRNTQKREIRVTQLNIFPLKSGKVQPQF